MTADRLLLVANADSDPRNGAQVMIVSPAQTIYTLLFAKARLQAKQRPHRVLERPFLRGLIVRVDLLLQHDAVPLIAGVPIQITQDCERVSRRIKYRECRALQADAVVLPLNGSVAEATCMFRLSTQCLSSTLGAW